MDTLSHDPVLGHINTFGGHPVCCAAGMAAFNVLLEMQLVKDVKQKEALFLKELIHPRIKAVRSRGLMIAVELDGFEINKQLIDELIHEGVFTDWFLFASHCLRIAPPLTIGEDEIREACQKIVGALNKIPG